MVDSGVQSEVTVRLKLKSLWRFRPRLFTLAVLSVIGAMIVLANLTEEIHRPDTTVLDAKGEPRFSVPDAATVDPKDGDFGGWSVSYGWPLLWRQYFLYFIRTAVPGVAGECHSSGRLALNVVMWLVMLAVPGAACEWLLRRHRPRLRWNVRTMLAAIGLAAALCGWFVVARKRADVQDAVIAVQGWQVWVKRWGPRWLDLVGADRYRRRIVGAKVDLTIRTIRLTDEHKSDEDDLKRKTELIARLGHLREVEYLFIETDNLRAEMVDALRSMRQLRVLSINVAEYGREFSPEGTRISHECLAAIGAMSDLEHLSLTGMPVASESLACLAGLTNLKSLRLQVAHDADELASDAPLLSRLPPLPRLEALDLAESFVGDRGLRYLSVLPCLKTLNLNFTDVTACEMEEELGDSTCPEFEAGLAEMAGLELLEEVTVTGDMASEAGLKSLLALKRLKRLHIGGPYRYSPTEALPLDDGRKVEVPRDDIDEYARALGALRRANPGIVIDGDDDALDWPGELLVPDEYETLPEGMVREWGLRCLDEWKNRSRLNKATLAKPVGGY